MRLVAIFNVWADCLDLLPYAIGNIYPVVDGVIVIWSEYSNHGQRSEACYNYVTKPHSEKITFHQCEPHLGFAAHGNELLKRNFGLELAKKEGYTHFLMLDGDEFYDRLEFEQEKQRIIDNNIIGTVCKTQVYFKKPTLTVGLDHTLVPFIHKLDSSLKFGNFPNYPFTYDAQGNAHIDPTRRLNIVDGVVWSDITMHHMSWVRSDYNLKIENSSAARNLKKSSVYRDLEEAKEGHYNEFYRSHLVTCENKFNIPDL